MGGCLIMTDNEKKKIIDEYLYTDFWKKAYETAPSQNCKDYILLGLRGFIMSAEGEIFYKICKERKGLEKNFDLEDWQHLYKYCGDNPFKGICVTKIKELGGKV